MKKFEKYSIIDISMRNWGDRMKNIIRIVNILIIALIVINLLTIQSNAAISIGNIESSAKEFLDKGSSNTANTISVSEMQAEIKPIAGILTAIGSGVLLICAIIIGMKYMVASPDEQAKLRKQMVGLIVAAIVIFGAYNIWKMLYNFLESATK